MDKQLDIFVTYIRTKQLMNGRLKGADLITKPIHIQQKEIEKRFFVYPKYNRREALNYLVENNEISITSKPLHNGRSIKLYEALKPGNIDLRLLEVKQDNFTNPIIKQIREYLLNVGLTANAPSTSFFDAFLQHKDQHLNHFFTVDEFARRIHTPITNFHREYRSNILFFGDEVTSLDVATMQPLLLGKILKKEIGENEFSNWINTGKDIYLMLQEKANLNNRDEAKKRFFEILFAPPSNGLEALFGATNWIEWINIYKTINEPGNTKPSKNKPHNNLAWLLQTTEVAIMYKVWEQLYENKIPFLTVHDEVLIRKGSGRKAEKLFGEVLNNEFEYYKLNNKVETHPHIK